MNKSNVQSKDNRSTSKVVGKSGGDISAQYSRRGFLKLSRLRAGTMDW
jgi:hypothetical protein